MTAAAIDILKRELEVAHKERDDTFTDTEPDIRAGRTAQGLRDSAQRRLTELKDAINVLEMIPQMEQEVSE